MTARAGRIGIAAAVAGAHGLAILILLSSSGMILLPGRTDALSAFDIQPPPPPPPLVAPDPAGHSAPPAPRARPAPVAAPPVPRPAAPRPPVAAEGADRSAGAAAEGVGSGAGGEGSGLGAGGDGDGTGGGIAVPARRIAGRIVDADYPRAARRERAEGRVIAMFTVAPDGRAYDCAVHRSSGNAALDDTTCRLIEQRFRFAPARDARGRAVADRAGWQQDWWFEGR